MTKSVYFNFVGVLINQHPVIKLIKLGAPFCQEVIDRYPNTQYYFDKNKEETKKIKDELLLPFIGVLENKNIWIDGYEDEEDYYLRNFSSNDEENSLNVVPFINNENPDDILYREVITDFIIKQVYDAFVVIGRYDEVNVDIVPLNEWEIAHARKINLDYHKII
jgi:hypothetical protein